MPSIPKPKKEDRILDKQMKKELLKEYRHMNVSIAILRDNNQCVYCWFILGEKTMREEVHHVYSRGTAIDDWREHYTNLICVCKEHHPMAIQFPGASQTLGWVEDLLQNANISPINRSFSHSKYSQVINTNYHL